MDKPKPGTEDARQAGCICATMDNHYGKGRYGDGEKYGWYIREGCPVHGAVTIERRR